MATVLYLETFVDSTQNLPPDLQRQLTMIKSLDEKCEVLQARVQAAVAELMATPPQHSAGSPSEEYVELSRRIDADQRMLLQFSEEKVQVAQQVGLHAGAWRMVHAWSMVMQDAAAYACTASMLHPSTHAMMPHLTKSLMGPPLVCGTCPSWVHETATEFTALPNPNLQLTEFTASTQLRFQLRT